MDKQMESAYPSNVDSISALEFSTFSLTLTTSCNWYDPNPVYRQGILSWMPRMFGKAHPEWFLDNVMIRCDFDNGKVDMSTKEYGSRLCGIRDFHWNGYSLVDPSGFYYCKIDIRCSNYKVDGSIVTIDGDVIIDEFEEWFGYRCGLDIVHDRSYTYKKARKLL